MLDHYKLAKEYYHEDAQWYLDNMPFFECSDKQIEQVYYYRWKLIKRIYAMWGRLQTGIFVHLKTQMNLYDRDCNR